MRICLLTSSSLRHSFVAHRLAAHHDIALLVRQDKTPREYYEKPDDKYIVEDHFRRFAATERGFFASASWDAFSGPVIDAEWGQLNTDEISARLRECAPEAVVVFGCGMIKPPLLDVLPQSRTLNLHQGLSPYYRGSGTNFWPFVHGCPQYIGVTLHLLDAGIDTGDIVAHERPDIEPTDTQAILGCKTVIKSADLALAALDVLQGGRQLRSFKQWGEGGILCKGKQLNAEAIQTVRKFERKGFLADFLSRREAGEISPVRLIDFES